MAINSVLTPFPVFTDNAGLPLDGGFIYIGQPGFEARTTPKASFFDVGQTIPTGTASGAAVRTRGGLPVNNSNAPAMFYVDGDYSISVCDRNGVLLYSALTPTLALNEGGVIGPVLGPDGNFGAVGIGFLSSPNTGFVRGGAGSIQTVVSGTLVSQQTATGVTFSQPVVFSQPVSGAGFDSGVLNVAQPVSPSLTSIAGLTLVAGDLLVATGPDTVARLPIGANGTVLGVVAGAPAYTVAKPADWGAPFASGTLSGSGVTVTGLGGFSSVMVVLIDSTLSGANIRQVRVGGASIITSSVYKSYNDTRNHFRMSDGVATARSASLVISRFNTTDDIKPVMGEVFASSFPPVAIADATAMQRLQILVDTGTYTGGEYYIYGRV